MTTQSTLDSSTIPTYTPNPFQLAHAISNIKTLIQVTLDIKILITNGGVTLLPSPLVISLSPRYFTANHALTAFRPTNGNGPIIWFKLGSMAP